LQSPHKHRTNQKIAVLIAEFVKKRLIAEIKAQGHNLTGRLVASVAYEIKYTQADVSIIFSMEDYGLILNKGVAANRIPYTSNSGAPRSKYIEGLKRYARLRFGASEKEATRIAFAIANAQKRDGMPTRKSYRFSKTGKRTEFIEEVLQDSQNEILRLLNGLEFEFLQAA